jgi:hypothetical protein
VPISNNFNIIKAICDLDIRLTNTTKNAINFGDLELLKFAITDGYDFKSNDNICYDATTSGKLEILKFFVNNGCEIINPFGFNVSLSSIAIKSGDVELLKYLDAKGLCIWYDWISSFCLAIEKNKLNSMICQ